MANGSTGNRPDEAGIPLEDQAMALIEYWRGKARNGRLPARSDLDPMDIPSLLPHVGLIDVIDDGRAFRYRLLGTHLNQVFGEDFTGKSVEDIKVGAYGALLMDLYRSMLTAKGPVVSDSVFEFRQKDFLTVRRILLPLSGDGVTVDMILFMNIFRSRDAEEIPVSTVEHPLDPQFDQHQVVASRELSRRTL